MLKGPGQARLEPPPRREPVQSQCPRGADIPVPIAGVPDAGKHGCGCLKSPLGRVLQSRTKIHINVMPARAGRDAEAAVRGTRAPAMLFPAQHQCSLVTLGTFCFCLCVGRGQQGAPSLAKPFSKGLPQPFTALRPSQGWTGTGTALGSAHFLPLRKKPFPS